MVLEKFRNPTSERIVTVTIIRELILVTLTHNIEPIYSNKIINLFIQSVSKPPVNTKELNNFPNTDN